MCGFVADARAENDGNQKVKESVMYSKIEKCLINFNKKEGVS